MTAGSARRGSSSLGDNGLPGGVAKMMFDGGEAGPGKARAQVGAQAQLDPFPRVRIRVAESTAAQTITSGGES